MGSLLWDDGKDNIRKRWREERLLVDHAITVAAPIRYGRKSVSRGGTYTMVLSMKAENGRAKVFPCAKPVHDGVGLLEEAVHLWQAESQNLSVSALSDTWGCIALKIRDGFKCSDEIMTKWLDTAKSDPEQFKIKHAHDELPLLDNSGLLQVWPSKADGEPFTEVDALLVACNQPTLTAKDEYADPYDIARAWLKCPEHDHYFYKNSEHGIKTFEDDAILEEIWRAHHGGCGGPIVC
ncbi:hypothetical protein BH11CYA1_BH11CYA1_20450 [soil metagenome]